MTQEDIRQFENENLDRIIDMKVNDCVPGVHFVYLHEDGSLKIGKSDDFGHSAVEMYGGHKPNRGLAKADLNYIFSMREHEIS